MIRILAFVRTSTWSFYRFPYECVLLFQLSGGCELTVVIHDFLASNGGSSGELTVRRGQTVEVLERLHDKPDWCLVRTTDRSPAQEGIVPCSMLCIAHSRSSMEMEGLFNHKGRRRIFPFIFNQTVSSVLENLNHIKAGVDTSEHYEKLIRSTCHLETAMVTHITFLFH